MVSTKIAEGQNFLEKRDSIDELNVYKQSVYSDDDSNNSELLSDNESCDSFVSPDPGLWQTLLMNSDEEADIVDWDAPFHDKLFLNKPYTDSEAKEDKAKPFKNCLKSKKFFGKKASLLQSC